MIRWFAKNDIATNLIMIGILFVGFFIALPKMPVEINPSYAMRMVYIDFRVPGATPEDVERLIIIPVENKLNSISGIKDIDAMAYYSRAKIYVHATDTVNLADLKNDIESSIARLPSLPPDTDKPRVSIPDPNKWHEVISVMVSGDLTARELLAAGRQVRDDLMATPGISSIDLQGNNLRRIYIEPSIEALRTHKITLSDISKAVRENSVDLTAGRISSSSSGVQVSAKNQAISQRDFEDITIKVVNDAELKIRDIAVVKDSFDDEKKIFLFNGRPCIRVEVLRLKHESALTVAHKVHQYVEKARDRFPEGIELSIWDDESISLRSRIHILQENLIQGAVLVLIVLAVFLRPSLAFFVVLGVPISFAGGLILMHLMGVSINMWTLFGFIIVLGIVVDDAIVTAENVHSKLMLGGNRLDAVVAGTQEVATPVTFGVITTIVAFIPLMFLEGYIGNIAKQIPLVVIPVLLFSLFESKFILPGHLKHNYNFLGSANPFRYIQRGVNHVLDLFITYFYSPIIKFCVSFRYTVVIAFIVTLVCTFAYVTSDHFKYEKIPKIERYIISAQLEMPPETELQVTHEKLLKITQSVEQLRAEFMDGETGKSLIGHLFTSTGGRNWGGMSPSRGYIYLAVTPPSRRDPNTKNEDMITNQVIANRWAEIVGEVEGANKFFISGMQRISRSLRDSAPIEIELRGANEENKAIVADQIKEWIEQQEWANYATFDKGKKSRQLNLKVNANGAAAGLTDASLARQVRSQLLGETAQRFQFGEDEIRVQVRLPDEERESTHALNLIRIKTRNGESSLRSVATFEETFGEPSIERNNRTRILHLRAATTTEAKTSTNMHVKSIATKLDELCTSNHGVSWRYIGEIAKAKETEKRMLISGATLLFTLFALLAIPFKSLIQPIFVLIAVPLGIVGALLGHMHMDATVSYLSLFGILALSGVVVNDSLVIVDFINRKRLEGGDVKQAIIDSGIKRFRPIMLTSITTFAGLYPIMNETAIEATFLKPMAISLGFGILYATLITLILIPCAYMVSEDVKRGFKWFFTGKGS